MERIIDIHTHILPCVDDGSDGMARTLDMIKNLASEGVTDIVCTPHYRLDMFLTPATEDKRVFEQVKKEVEDLGLKVKLYLGQELHDATEMLSQVKSGQAITINGTKFVLLELDWHTKGDYLSVVKDYKANGYTPILAHYERFCYYNLDDVKELRKAGALFQVNAFSFFGVESEQHKINVLEMLDNGLVDFISSDYHHWKKPYIKDCYAFILKKYGVETARKVFCDNALKLLGE